jgi:hypothetical protein
VFIIFSLCVDSVKNAHGGRPWMSDFNDPNYLAGRAAMKNGECFSANAVHPQN